MRRLALICMGLISVLPVNSLRILLYRVAGYKIGKHVKIGIFTVLMCETCSIGNNVTIGRKNSIKTKTFEVGDKTRIGNNNTFVGWADYSKGSEKSNFIKIGEECLITQGHLLDGSFGIEVGDSTWIAGRNSSFWSHGSTRTQKSIEIGRKCYIGSDVKVGTDVKLGDEVLVAMGSIVTRGCPSQCTIAGNPAKVNRENYIWHEHWA